MSDAATATRVIVESVTKRYNRDAVPALDNVRFEIEPGELLAILGPSGSGKTTLLNVLAGLEPLDAGRLLFGGRDVTNVPAERRNVGVVFQSSMLYPHLSLRDSIAFGPRIRKLDEKEITARIDQVAGWLGIKDLLKRRPHQVSGGERQRAAIAKALVSRPALLLMDEPFSAVDAQLRRQLRSELVRLHREFATTTVFVTHDQEEALGIADRVAVMRSGKLAQLSDPLTLYRQPASAWVADFVGVQPVNLLRARKEDHTALQLLDGAVLVKPPQMPGAEEFTLGLRPENVRLRPGAPTASLRIYTREVIAGQLKYTLRASSGAEITAVSNADQVFDKDAPVDIDIEWPRALAFDIRTGQRLEVSFGG